jgi:hypothetical protein
VSVKNCERKPSPLLLIQKSGELFSSKNVLRRLLLPPGPLLPDGIFSNQKSQFGKILEGLRMENVGIFYGQLKYFRAIWYILWSFGNGLISWYLFHCFGILCQEKSGNPVLDRFSSDL